MESKDLKKKLQDYEYRTEELTKDVEQLKNDYQVRTAKGAWNWWRIRANYITEGT